MITQMQARKTNSQMILMGFMMPSASISPIYPVVFYARAILLWWLRLRPASTGAHPAVLCYLLGSISGCAFCYSPLLCWMIRKHESSSSRRVNGNSQSAMGPCLTHHREDKSWFWLLQKTAFSLVKSRLALESPGCSFVYLVFTMLKMAQYTGKCLLTAP